MIHLFRFILWMWLCAASISAARADILVEFDSGGPMTVERNDLGFTSTPRVTATFRFAGDTLPARFNLGQNSRQLLLGYTISDGSHVITRVRSNEQLTVSVDYYPATSRHSERVIGSVGLLVIPPGSGLDGVQIGMGQNGSALVQAWIDSETKTAARMFRATSKGGRWTVRRAEAVPVQTPMCLAATLIKEESDAIKSIASRLAADDKYYLDAVSDILLQGYNSAFARLGLDIDERSIPNLLSTSAKKQAARSSIVATTQRKANWRAALASAIARGNPGSSETTEPRGFPITVHRPSPFSNESLEYFCSRDPSLMEHAWSDLYGSGYIDYKLYSDVAPTIWLKNALEVSLEQLVVFAATESVVALWAVRESVVLLNRAQAQLLVAAGKREALVVPAQALAEVINVYSADVANTYFLSRWFGPGRSPENWISSWKPSTDVVRKRASKAFQVDHLYAGSDPLGQWVTPELVRRMSRKDAGALLDIPSQPTHVVQMEIREGAVFWEGLSTSGGRQIFVENRHDLRIVDGTVQELLP